MFHPFSIYILECYKSEPYANCNICKLTLEYFGSLQPTTARMKTTIRNIGEMAPQQSFQKKDGSLPIINAISLLTFLNPYIHMSPTNSQIPIQRTANPAPYVSIKSRMYCPLLDAHGKPSKKQATQDAAVIGTYN